MDYELFKGVADTFGLAIKRGWSYSSNKKSAIVATSVAVVHHPTDRTMMVEYSGKCVLVIKDNRPCFYYNIDQGWKLVQYLREAGYVKRK